ncbi:hypothetical protein QUB70_12120 [Microcoleus sp. A003_D6]|uniref:hypothetical protein n=1 Tax=Microcoleus sp. A003_D6 TaxID=3055266 RepID=UPI002FCFAF04
MSSSLGDICLILSEKSPAVVAIALNFFISVTMLSCRAFKLHIRGGLEAHPTRV